MSAEFDKKLAKVLSDVCDSKGVTLDPEDNNAMYVDGEYLNSYMAVYVLAEMLEAGDCTIEIHGQRERYLRKLVTYAP